MISFTSRMWFGIVCGLIWIWLGPFLINNYVQKINETFLNAKDLKILRIENYNRTLVDANTKLGKFGVLNVIWVLFILAIAVFDNSYLNRFGIGNFTDPYFYIFLLMLAYVLYFTSVGIRGVLIVYQLINELVNENKIKLDFYNSDKMGGLKCFKELIYTAAKLFATGVLFFPILLDYILYTSDIRVKVALYLSIILFTVILIMTFFIPIKKLYDYANEHRDMYLNELGGKLKCLATDLIENEKNCSIKDGILIINYCHQINIISTVSVFDVASDTYLQIIGSILIPFFTYFINSQDIINIFQALTK